MKPKYIAIAAVTLDGKIAKSKNHMSDWTSKEDKDFLHKMLDKCDVVLVGNNTYKTAVEPLSKRNCIVLTGKIKKPLQKSKNLLYINPKATNLGRLIAKKKYRRVAILGGTQTYSYCLENNLLDEIYLTIEPLVFGKGINLFESQKFIEYKFKLASIKKLNSNGTLLLHYKKFKG